MSECEWNPSENRLCLTTEASCPDAASVWVWYAGGIHLCASCAKSPRFRAFKKRPLARGGR